MKKLVFAAVAAIVMVSVSNVFAYSTKASFGTAIPADTTVVDTVAPVEQPSDTTVATPSDSDDTAMLMMSDTTTVDSTKTDTASVNTPDVA